MFSASKSASAFVAVVAAGLVLLGCNRKSESPVQTVNPTETSNAIIDAQDSRRASKAFGDVQDRATPTNEVARQPENQLRQLVLELTGKDLDSGRTTTDRDGRPAGTTFQDGSRLMYQDSKPIRFIDPRGQVTAFTYANERLARIVYPDGSFKVFPTAE